MNFIRNLFCRKTKTDQSEEEFEDTHDTEDGAIKKQGTTGQIKEELENLQNDLQYKRIALDALKKKKRYEKQLRDIDNTLSTLALQRDALQNFEVETTVMSALNASLGTLEEILKNINLEMADKSDLELELEQLGRAELDKATPDIPLINLTSDVPVVEIAITTTSESELEDIKINS